MFDEVVFDNQKLKTKLITQTTSKGKKRMSTHALSTFVLKTKDAQIWSFDYLLYVLFVLDFSFFLHVLLSMFLNAIIVNPSCLVAPSQFASYLFTLVIWPWKNYI